MRDARVFGKIERTGIQPRFVVGKTAIIGCKKEKYDRGNNSQVARPEPLVAVRVKGRILRLQAAKHNGQQQQADPPQVKAQAQYKRRHQAMQACSSGRNTET